MKRILFFALMTMACLLLHAQSIVTDETKNGRRVISTDDIICRTFKDKMVLSVSLFATVDDVTGQSLSLCTKLSSTTSFEAGKDCVMLIRLMDDSVLEFKSFSGEKVSQVNVQNVNGLVIRTQELTLMFDVAESQLETMGNVGVKKVRIGVTPDMYDKEFKKDKVGAAVDSLWDVMKAALAKPTKSVYDNF